MLQVVEVSKESDTFDIDATRSSSSSEHGNISIHNISSNHRHRLRGFKSKFGSHLSHLWRSKRGSCSFTKSNNNDPSADLRGGGGRGRLNMNIIVSSIIDVIEIHRG